MTFNVVATTDLPPLTYQWRRNGVSIPGATTSTWSVNSFSEVWVGSYDVVVSNAWGIVTSAPPAQVTLRSLDSWSRSLAEARAEARLWDLARTDPRQFFDRHRSRIVILFVLIVVTWFLLGGSMYSAYTFIAVPAVTYGVGAIHRDPSTRSRAPGAAVQVSRGTPGRRPA